MVLRTVTVMIKQNSAGHVDVDGNGQMLLSCEDLDFIREKETGVGTGKNSEELRFFEATQPGKRG